MIESQIRFFRLVNLTLVLWLAIPLLSFSQHPDNYFSPDEVKEDLKWLKSKVLAYHPACLDSIRYDSVNIAFQLAGYEAEKQLQELQFLKLLRQTLMSLRCGHTTAIPSKDFYTYYRISKPKPMYPLQVYAGDEGLIVRFNESDDKKIAIGDKIITINQESTSEITNSILNFVPGDGYHSSFKKYQLSLNFPTYYLFHKGPNYNFESGIIDTLGKYSLHSFSLRSKGKTISRQSPQKSIKIINSDKYKIFGTLTLNPKVGIVKVLSFAGNPSWYRSAFSEIQKKKLEYLILDLRGNAGGNIYNAHQLLSYLMPDTFSLQFERKKQKIRFNGNSDLGLFDRLTMKYFEWLPSKTKGFNPTSERIGDLMVNRFRFDTAHRFRFKGKLIVLMDGGTFSASSMVAAQLRSKLKCNLIGDESGGGATGTYAMIIPTLTLPNTKMRVYLPLYRINHENNQLAGRGLLPDFYLFPNIGKKIKGIDSELDYLSKNLQWFKTEK